MNCEKTKILAASPADLSQILALLSAVDLPHDGVAEHLKGFLVAQDFNGKIVGTVGMEHHGSVGLLRSAAVAPDFQRTGLGSCLTSALIARASTEGLEKLVLLTSTARTFFADRFGFIESRRENFDEQLGESAEWHLPRCSSAACMSLDLRGEEMPGRTSETNV